MKVLDRYLTRELLIPILYICLALIFLILIADLFDNLDDLLRHNIPLRVIFSYYLSLVPFAFTQIIAWSIWLGTLFLLVNLGFHNELTAMKSAGLKITTIIRPVMFLGFVFGILTFLLNDRVVPPTFREASQLREIYIEKKKKETAGEAHNITYYAKGNQLYFFREFSESKKEVQGAVALWLSHEGSSKRKKMVAKSGHWNGSVWEFEGVTEYLMDVRGRILGEPQTFPKRIYEEIDMPPSELSQASRQSAFLTYRELKQWTEKLRENKIDVHSEAVDLQARLASPWQGLVMMLVSIPLLARTNQRKLIAFNVLVCVGIVFAFHVFGAVGMALGKAGKIFPFLSAWLGNILFAAGALLYLEKANY